MRKTITLTLAVLGLIALTSCTKKEMGIEDPQPRSKACLLSDKYRADSTYIVTDTIWQDPNLKGRWLDSVKLYIQRGDVWIGKLNCPPLGYSKGIPIQFECHRYVLGDRITYPKIFKP